MSGSMIGAIKTAAARLGVSVEQYRQRIDAGEKWCTGCKAWHARGAFDSDRSRGDGLKAACRTITARPPMQLTMRKVTARRGDIVQARDGDRKQARRRVNYLVERGELPRPNDLPCSDCGHVWKPGERRHEYDHHLGYAAEHQRDVEPVCSSCHHAREQRRAA